MHNYCTNWDAFPTEKLVRDINGGAGTETLHGGSAAWSELAATLRDADVSTRVALQTASAGYTGQGAEAMTAATTPFRDWADTADTMSGRAADAATATGEAFSTARNAMPGPSELVDPSTVHDSFMDNAKAFFANSQTDGEKAESAAAVQHQQAAQAMSSYESQVFPHTQPFTWPTPPVMTASSAAPTAAAGTPGHTTASAWAPQPQTDLHPAADGPRPPTDVNPVAPGGQIGYPSGTTTGYQVPAGTTAQSTGYSPTGYPGAPGTSGQGANGSGNGTHGSGSAGPGTGGFGAGGVPGFGGVGGSGAGDSVRARRGYGPGMSFDSGTGGAGSAAGGTSNYGGPSASGSGGAAGSGSGGSAGGGAGASGSGVTTGASGATGAGGTGSSVTGSNASGGRGTSGMGGAGGRGGQGAEDDEHETPDYLKHFEHFEDGRVVAPPVIGLD